MRQLHNNPIAVSLEVVTTPESKFIHSTLLAICKKVRFKSGS